MAMMAAQAVRPVQPAPTSSRRPGDSSLTPKRAPTSRLMASPGAGGLPSRFGGRPWSSTALGAGPPAPLSQPLQRKLTVGAVDDPLEREADRIAEQVVAGPQSPAAVATPQLQRKCACGGSADSGGECEACKQKRLQRTASGPGGGAVAPQIVHETLRSSGRPLDGAVRTSMESRFGHDFGNVRVHADARAAESASAVNALAYTVGHHIVFGAGQHDVHSAAGSRLLAHELTHVVQQDAGGNRLRRQLRAAPEPRSSGAGVPGSAPPLSRGASAPAAVVAQGSDAGAPRPAPIGRAGGGVPLRRPITARPGTGDEFLERDVDRIVDDRNTPQALGVDTGGVAVLQRTCACGGAATAGGECEACREKRLQRRSIPSASSLGSAAPPVVHEALQSSGQPLDGRTQASMGAYFGHDFSHVRLHMDTLAADSASAVDADAYTVGHDVVFAAGRYDPGSAAGRRLLAHELTHVVQQGGGRALLQRETRTPTSGSNTGTPPAGGAAPPAAAPAFVCGPDVTQQVTDVIAKLRSDWGGWSSDQRGEACASLENVECGPDAWDIVQLHNNAWIYKDYRPACASEKADPKCGSSVQVGSDCHNAGSVNYVIFGVMCDLCGIWKWTMHMAIRAHKIHLSGYDADFDASMAWADAGYHSWPAGSTPSGDRNNCAPTCPTPYGPTANNGAVKFDYHWYPAHATEYVNQDCDDWMAGFRAMRDNPNWEFPAGF